MFKIIKTALVFVSIFFLAGCSYFSFDWLPSTNYTNTLTTLPITVNGTIQINDEDYNKFSTYKSPTYNLTSVDDYNLVLLQTRDNIRRSNIQVVTTVTKLTPLFPGSKQMITQIVSTSSGSGVIYKEDATYYYAITNFHVIDFKGYDAVYEIMTFEDEDSSNAELIAYDESLDLAVLRFEKNDRKDVHIIDMTTRLYTKLTTDELILAVGNPFSLANNVTFGTFKNMVQIANASHLVIYHSATINEGSSGGALTDIGWIFNRHQYMGKL
jgi:S1-C subfamily serine protease